MISLVSVNAHNSLSSRKWGTNKSDKAGMALNKIQRLYQKFFKTREEKSAIEEAMKTLPSLANFAQFTKDPNTCPGLFDASSKSSDVHCLSAVTYYPENSHSVMLWLATTNENAPTEKHPFQMAESRIVNLFVLHGSEAACMV